MSGEWDRLGPVENNNEYRGKCDICEKYLGDSIAIYADNLNSLRQLKKNQQAHIDCYIDLCVEKKLNSLERHRTLLD